MLQQNTSQNIENKDTTSKTKDKAVEQMTKLQDTDTVVTEARTQGRQFKFKWRQL